ncbi:NB-ARC domain-containing protein [Streptomyces phaeochromogenes]|uniref:NB-ARC domain-containing protein n=1 Tax=Streptomyces phaeochromogenes TaxID=1923 RepID=UPI002E10A0CB|nr:NB-ARC domain-containing protein [Streptomyces phaeochromogenes]WSJ08820.1 NB-ARC domain-containing protein [Streptomyces phaeochromogenes]
MRVRVWVAGIVALAGLGIALAIVLALAGNAATATSRWPWLLDELRQHPWWSVGVFGPLAVVAGGIAAWLQLRPPVVLNDPPPPPPVAVPDWFVDRGQTRTTVSAVCGGGHAVGITTSLWGAGGFGKTTLATAVCAGRRVRRRFRSRIYPVTIGRDVRGRAAVAAKVVEVTRFITGDTTEFDDPALAGAHLGRLLDKRPRTLLVLDDVWEAEQLDPFLTGGRHCVRLVTTRNPALLPPGAQRIPVDQMSRNQAKAVLTWNLPPLPEHLVDRLLKATGRWALLLRLTNRLIAEQCATGADPTATAERILHRLRGNGPAAVDDPAATWNLDDPRLRNQAVKASIEAATTLLPPGGQDRFTELGIFAEDESIPVAVVALLWQASGQLTEEQTRTLCRDLERLSLLTLDPQHGGRISLHDVIRDYLRGNLGTAGLARLNGYLIDAVAAALPPAQPLAPTTPDPERAWWQLQDGYLLDHLIDHCLAAGRTTLAEAVAGDLRWVETRLTLRGPTALWMDLTRIETPHTRPLARSLAQAAHLLTPTDPPHALTGVLHTRLDTHPHWQPQITARQHDPAQRPCLANQWPLPDAPSPALQRTLTGHPGSVASVAVAPDGTWLATGGYDGTVRIWDRDSWTCTATLTDHTNGVYSVAVAPDGTWLATASTDGTVRIWDRVSGTLTATLTGHTDVVASVAVAPDGTWLATASHDRTVRIWDRNSGTCTATLTDHTNGVQSVAIAPDGTCLATASHDRTVRIWDRNSGTCTATLTGHPGPVASVAIAPDGTCLATASQDGTMRIWDRVSGTCTATLTDHTDGVQSVAIAPDGTWLATASRDKTVRIWDRNSGTCTATLTGHPGPVTSVAIAPDGTWLATTGHDTTVRIWDRMSVAHTSSRSGHTGSVASVAIAPDGTCLATASHDTTVRIWDRNSGTCTATLTGHPGPVASVAIAPDGTWLATGGYDGTMRIWDRVSGTCTATLTDHTDGVQSVAIAPDGTWLATVGNDTTVRIWDRDSWTCTATLTDHTDWLRSVAIAPDGTWFAAAGGDRTVRIWDRVSGTCTATLTGHTRSMYSVYSVAIAPDGTWLATASNDHTVRIWDRVSGTCTATLTGHTDGVQSVAIAPDGTWLATASNDTTVRIWAVADQRTVAMARAEGPLLSCAWGAAGELAVGGERGLYLFKLLT